MMSTFPFSSSSSSCSSLTLFLLFLFHIPSLILSSPSSSSFQQRSDILNYFNQTHPLIVIGLPKSGTTSVTDFLHLFKIKAAHQFLPMKYCQQFPNLYPLPSLTVENQIKWSAVHTPTHKCFVSQLIQYSLTQRQSQIQRGKLMRSLSPKVSLNPLRYLFKSGYYAITQMDACYEVNQWPQIDLLTTLLDAYPNAYFIHTIRPNLTAHVQSILHWSDLAHRMKINGELSRYPEQDLSTQTMAKNLEIFIINAHRIIRHHFKRYPGYKFLELDLTKNDSGKELAKFLNLKVNENFKMPHANIGNYAEEEEKERKSLWEIMFGSSRREDKE
jgi:hypothetical protein